MIRKVLYSVAEPSARRFFHVSAIQRPASHLYSRTSFMTMSTEAGTEKTEGEPKVETETVDEDVQIDPMKALEDANEALEKQVKEMKDKMLRALADEENVRRIAKRDVENARIYANTKFAKSLLDVADNLERALEAANSSNEADHVAFDNLVEGVKMTQNQLTKVFQSHGVVKVRKSIECFFFKFL